MNFIINLFGSLFGYLMNFLFSLTNSYALSVLLIVLVTKLVMFPIKQGMAKIKKKPKEERCTKDVVLRVFKTIFSVLQFFMLVGLYGAIISPITNVLRFDPEVVSSLRQLLVEGGVNRVNELSILNNLEVYWESFSYIVPSEQLEMLKEFKLHFTLGNVDLTQLPSIEDWSILIPMVSSVLTLAPFLIQLKGTKGQKVNMPLFFKAYMAIIIVISCGISFVLPVGVGYYFLLSRSFGLIEQWVAKLIHKKKNSSSVETVQPLASEADTKIADEMKSAE